MKRVVAFAAVLAVLLIAATAAAAAAPRLLVGVGRADITPVTGVYKGGWSCTCAEAIGQQERLYARVVVLQEGSQKVALVAEDLFAVSAGMIHDAAALLPGLGFSEANIIDSASHDHSSPTGYMNFGTYNSVLPSDARMDLSGDHEDGYRSGDVQLHDPPAGAGDSPGGRRSAPGCGRLGRHAAARSDPEPQPRRAPGRLRRHRTPGPTAAVRARIPAATRTPSTRP